MKEKQSHTEKWLDENFDENGVQSGLFENIISNVKLFISEYGKLKRHLITVYSSHLGTLLNIRQIKLTVT